ncbi:serine/threonine-protein kinase haspin-like [Haemaphysalis longicornis]
MYNRTLFYFFRPIFSTGCGVIFSTGNNSGSVIPPRQRGLWKCMCLCVSEVSKIESCCSTLEELSISDTALKGPRRSGLTPQKLWLSSVCDWSPPNTGVQQLAEIGVADTASQQLFGDLLRECKYEKPVTFATVLDEIAPCRGSSGCVKLCEGCHSEVFQVSGYRGTGVIKVIRCEYLVRHLDLVLAEVRIGRTLRGLSKSLENNTTGFSELREAYCVWDRYPEVMVNACIDYYGWRKFTQFNDEERELCRPYAVLYLSYAGVPLHEAKLQSAMQLRSVVQQVALTLAVGEAALQFEHRALSASQVLVRGEHDQVLSFWLDGRILFVDSFGLQASLVDFSVARAQPPESQPIFGDLSRMPKKKQEALGHIFDSVFSVVGKDQSRFFPCTNLLLLAELTSHLVQSYEGRFGGAVVEAESQAWRDVCFWLDLMPRCTGVKDFVDQVLVPSACPTTPLSVL